jgi:hypothetical protein
MRFENLTTTQAIGVLVVILGNLTLIFVDPLVGIVWILLGASLFLFHRPEDRYGTKRIEWNFRNLHGMGALIFAIVLVVIDAVVNLEG